MTENNGLRDAHLADTFRKPDPKVVMPARANGPNIARITEQLNKSAVDHGAKEPAEKV